MSNKFLSRRSTTSQFNCAALHIWAEVHSALEFGRSAAQLAKATTASSGPRNLTIVYPGEPTSADNAKPVTRILQSGFSLCAGVPLELATLEATGLGDDPIFSPDKLALVTRLLPSQSSPVGNECAGLTPSSEAAAARALRDGSAFLATASPLRAISEPPAAYCSDTLSPSGSCAVSAAPTAVGLQRTTPPMIASTCADTCRVHDEVARYALGAWFCAPGARQRAPQTRRGIHGERQSRQT